MIHFDQPAEPKRFDERVRKPGLQWLFKHPNAKRPRDYWLQVRADLAKGFGDLCGYSAMYEPVGTVDHFISWDECKRLGNEVLAYEWENYRFASGWINSSKRNLTADQVLDPFEVKDGWFEILLPSLQMQVSNTIPPAIRDKAEQLLERLHLRDDERVIRQREAWYELYRDGDLTLAGLEKKAPMIARAVEKRGK